MGDQRMEVGSLVAFEVIDCRNTDDILSIQATMLDEKYGVVGKADVPLAERHRLQVPEKLVVADASAVELTPAGSKKRPLEDEGGVTATPPTGKKKKGNGEATPQENGASSEKKKKKEKKEKKEKKDKKSKKKDKA